MIKKDNYPKINGLPALILLLFSNLVVGELEANNLRLNTGASFSSVTASNIAWDIDQNGQADALTDGLLLLRYLFGFRGETLINGAVGFGATLTTAIQIEANLREMSAVEGDIDGNGSVDALTDGLLLLRYLFGFRGDTLTNGAIGANATRSSNAAIEAYLQQPLQIVVEQGDLAAILNAIDYGNAGDNIWVEPTTSQVSIFRTVMSEFLNANFNEAHALAEGIGYEVVRFINTVTSSTAFHYLLREKIQPGNAGFIGGGTYVYNLRGENAVFQVPHPRADSNTAVQGIASYFIANPSLLLLSGTRRDSSTAQSPCSGSFFASDVAHNNATLFHEAHRVASDANSQTVFIEFHGFGTSSRANLQSASQCNTTNNNLINLSEGINYVSSLTEDSLMQRLRSEVERRGTVAVCLFGNQSTSLGGTTNVSGRFTNGSIDSPCTNSASISSRRFVHLEQSFDVRLSHRQLIAEAIRDALN